MRFGVDFFVGGEVDGLSLGKAARGRQGLEPQTDPLDLRPTFHFESETRWKARYK